MQRRRGTVNSFPATVDLNQGSPPDDTSMDDSASNDNMLNPVENHLNSSANGSGSQINATNNDAWSFSCWDRGESSSSKSNVQDGTRVDDSRLRLGSPLNASSEPSNILSGSYFRNDRNFGMQNVSSNHGHLQEHECHKDLGTILPLPSRQTNYAAMEPPQSQYASSSNEGTSSGSSFAFPDNIEALGLPFSNWGSSCKRKALDGTHGQVYPGGGSSSNWPSENNIMHHPAPRNLSISSSTLNLSPAIYVEPLNTIGGISASRIAPVCVPRSSVPAMAESSIRPNHWQRDPVQYGTPGGTSVRHVGGNAARLSRPILNTNSPELSIMLPHLMHVNEARRMHLDPRDGPSTLRGGSIPVREENHRNTLQHPATLPALETRNILHDRVYWSFDPRASAFSRNQLSGSQPGLNSDDRSYFDARSSHQNHQTYQNHQQLSGTASGVHLLPQLESESGNRRSHSTHLPSMPTLGDDVASTSHNQHQYRQSSAEITIEIPNDFMSRLRVLPLADRHRLLRRYVMRRGVHLNAEDLMVIDPFIHNFPEQHDSHSDMRLDVDNMSYEELLALGEQIGEVSTGLSEEKITSFMKQRRLNDAIVALDPCCICQEEYVCGDDLGILDCGHEFHPRCIRQWLMVKNICPICKTTGLGP